MTKEQEEKYIKEYLETYSVSEIVRRYEGSENINRREVVKILKLAGVYEGLNGPNYLKKKAENYKNIMLERYGVDNWSRLENQWDTLNEIPYTKFSFLEDEVGKYKKKVSKLAKKYLKKCLKNNLAPDYCEYTGILFADSEFDKVNPNDPRKRTLDHKVSVIQCFFNGVSPEDCSSEKNLTFVLRYVNTLKGCTSHEDFLPIAQKLRKVLINEGYKSN